MLRRFESQVVIREGIARDDRFSMLIIDRFVAVNIISKLATQVIRRIFEMACNIRRSKLTLRLSGFGCKQCVGLERIF